MKFSETWLRQWVNPAIDSDALMHQVTMAGLEVDGAEPVAGEFTGVVVAEIESAEPHPNADKLQVCRVNDGTESWSVVCGAPNARAGLKVAFARVGAVLPGDFKIKKAKLRQVESFGMLCSGKELELSDDHDGIMELPADAPLGTDIRSYLNLDDLCIEVDLTPNRADCLSIAGLAREVGVLNEVPVCAPEIPAVPATVSDMFPIAVMAPEGCPRYLGRVIRNIDAKAVTPVWMQERLRRGGVRSIDPVVDVTNYVMLELGQPMHGFDLATLNGGIHVRWANEGESLTLLDGQTVNLRSDTLVIADEKHPLAMAGVMGGENTGISGETRDIFLECAFFAPLQLAGKARSYGLHTDSSHRYERGVDHALQARAMERATALLLEIVGGEPGPVSEVVAEEHLPNVAPVTVSHAQIAAALGLDIPTEQVTRILTGLGFGVDYANEQWTVSVPGWRFDISITADLIEEVGRIYGYDRLPVSYPVAPMAISPLPESVQSGRLIAQRMVSLGYQEVVSYSFVAPELQALLEPDVTALALANPISEDLGVMRTTVIAGLLGALQHNIKRQQDRVRLFETGLVFRGALDTLQQDKKVAGLIYGPRSGVSWLNGAAGVDFYDLKGDVEALLALSEGNEITFAPTNVPYLHPGQAAIVMVNGESVGVLGRIHPRLDKALGLKKPAYVFELDFNAVITRRIPVYKGISRFPASRRDIAVVVGTSVPAHDLLSAAKTVAGEWVTSADVFDVYEGERIGAGLRSIALQLTWQHPERPMAEEEVTTAMNAVIERLQEDFEATLRS
ncbi:phenylalanine--tRNA ligase subunit beta [Salinispirillum sp. LH 10-3-1]|uniref:Phenylalanine--tRNA ligase beta subunit n=1 Tax=Salinispirillum sp. LH 10-3-1 TaxID=2952525 RepID=A0AB38YJ91_9GAMM